MWTFTPFTYRWSIGCSLFCRPTIGAQRWGSAFFRKTHKHLTNWILLISPMHYTLVGREYKIVADDNYQTRDQNLLRQASVFIRRTAWPNHVSIATNAHNCMQWELQEFGTWILEEDFLRPVHDGLRNHSLSERELASITQRPYISRGQIT